jgi:uncharacterized protein (DUF1501 family)
MNEDLPRRALLLGLGAAATLGSTRLALARAPGTRGWSSCCCVVPSMAWPPCRPMSIPPSLPCAPTKARDPRAPGGPLDLGGRFGLHPRLTNIHAMFQANEATVVQAIAGPYRTRSHFDAQALLENPARRRSAPAAG